MKVAVRYYTRTGNTKKLANAIASIAGVEAQSIFVPFTEDADILFLGSSLYAAGVDEGVKTFIRNIDRKRVKRVVSFSSAAFMTSTYPQIVKLFETKGIPLDPQEFHCRGQFQFLHRGHPDADDIIAVKLFARKILGK